MNEISKTDNKRLVALVGSITEKSESLTVENHEDMETANALLKETVAAEKEIEEVRTSMVKPLNDQVKQINALAKEFSAPVESAKLLVKEKILAFNRKQEEIRLAKERALQAGISACDKTDDRDGLTALDLIPDDVKSDPRFQIAFERAKFRIEESERIEAERVRQEAERKRIEETKAAQGAEMAEIERKQAEINAEKKRIEAERAQIENDKRTAELERLAKEKAKESEEKQVK